MLGTRNLAICGMTALALSATLTACVGNTTSSAASTSAAKSENTAASTTDAPDEDAIAFFTGQWRCSVEATSESTYGTTRNNEQMLDLNIAENGSCTVVPLEAHADLLSAEGTWEGVSGKTLTLHLSDRGIALTAVDAATLKGKATDFDIDGFDTVYFDFYG